MTRATLCLALLSAALHAEPLPNPFREIPPERNAWPLLVEAAGLVQNVDPREYLGGLGPYPDWREPYRPFPREQLAANAAALAKLDDALARPELARPVAADDFRLLGRLRELTRLRIQRAYARSCISDRLGAIRDLDAGLTFVDRLDDGPGSVVVYLVARACGAMVLNAAQVLLGPPPVGFDLANGDPTARLALPTYGPEERAAWQALARHAADETRAVSSLRLAVGGDLLERGIYLADPKWRAEAPGPAPTPEQVANVMSWFQSVASDVATEYAKPRPQRDFRRFDGLKEPTPPGLSEDWREALDSPVPMFVRLATRPDADRATRRLTVTAIALRLWAADHGRLPSDLAELGLPAGPLDPTDGALLRYRPRQGLIYALGRDARDHGGQYPDQVDRLWFVTDAPLPWSGPPPVPRRWTPPTRPLGLG
jgi:hypothetical protein